MDAKGSVVMKKQEAMQPNCMPPKQNPSRQNFDNGINMGSSTDSSESERSIDEDEDEDEGRLKKKPKVEVILPVGFLDPLPMDKRPPASWSLPAVPNLVMLMPPRGKKRSPLARKSRVFANSGCGEEVSSVGLPVVRSCRQFWKAGDYDGNNGNTTSVWPSLTAGIDHVRVHPKFLHSNATSHKWALGAVAELLDNALDEVHNGASYVNIDLLVNAKAISKKDNNKMLLVEDNGGGMTPDKMRQCMSLGYSAKSKMANTIGQYGNGFKTGTMRLGADVIVFSRCRGKYGLSATQSIGMLSYTFLRGTGQEDIVVPMIDYAKKGNKWDALIRSSPDDWTRNLETIVEWSPYRSENDLLRQFDFLQDQGTRIIIYNLWEDEEGKLELDFDADQHDIQLSGVNRDEKKIEMAMNYPNSRHFLTYRHSLRSYVQILYLRLPPGFHIILRGKDVNHHNLVNDMMHTHTTTYKPKDQPDEKPNSIVIEKPNQNISADVTIGFVKDAKYHIDIQGFNVYHKNRLIKPFWRVWNAAGSDGRGVIGVLEANFVEPAHDKQGFERTLALSRLENRLVALQKQYWSTRCQLIGYAQRRQIKNSVSPDRETGPSTKNKAASNLNPSGHVSKYGNSKLKSTVKDNDGLLVNDDSKDDASKDKEVPVYKQRQSISQHKVSPPSGDSQQESSSNRRNDQIFERSFSKAAQMNGIGQTPTKFNVEVLYKLKEENRGLKQSLEHVLRDLQYEKDRSNSLENRLQEAQQKLEGMDKEQEALITIFQEERDRHDTEEENLKNKLKDATTTVENLLAKVKALESRIGF